MPYTVVSFHAHPDDEALLTAGTLARAVAEGHRVVVVSATDGAAGLAAGAMGSGADLAERRRAELEQAAAALGCSEVHMLGYEDSGMDGRAGRDGAAFARVDPAAAAARLAVILDAVDADVLTIYDPAGGYGHPDHVQVHRVGIEAAALAGTPVVLEATIDRRPLLRILRVLAALGLTRRLGVDGAEWSPARFSRAYADPRLITHRVATAHYAPAKRAAMAAHVSQSSADEGVRTLAVFLRLPPVIFRKVFGHEWFVERGRRPSGRPCDDIFASLAAVTAVRDGDSPRSSALRGRGCLRGRRWRGPHHDLSGKV